RPGGAGPDANTHRHTRFARLVGRLGFRVAVSPPQLREPLLQVVLLPRLAPRFAAQEAVPRQVAAGLLLVDLTGHVAERLEFTGRLVRPGDPRQVLRVLQGRLVHVPAAGNQPAAEILEAVVGTAAADEVRGAPQVPVVGPFQAALVVALER